MATLTASGHRVEYTDWSLHKTLIYVLNLDTVRLCVREVIYHKKSIVTTKEQVLVLSGQRCTYVVVMRWDAVTIQTEKSVYIGVYMFGKIYCLYQVTS